MTSRYAKEIRSLYRACLKSAAKCPKADHRHMMTSYVRLKFKSRVGFQDNASVALALKEAREELERMEYYHSIYAAKLEQQQEKQQDDGGQVQMATECPNCDQPYQPDARFCIYCGVKRPIL